MPLFQELSELGSATAATSSASSEAPPSAPESVVSRAAEMATRETSAAQGKKTAKPLAPQEAIDDFWAKFVSKTPGKATTVIPHNPHAERVAARNNAQVSCTTAQSSFESAAAMCRAKVDKIVKECRRINKRYRDPHFDLETDLKCGFRDCLQSLSGFDDAGAPPGADFKPLGAKRVVDIFDKPQLYIDGPTATDVRQGRDGDCWLMAALCTLSNKKGLIEKLLVAHDQDVGVYGFVFHRDGEWISEIIDDFLYLTKPDYDESYHDRILFDELERANPEEAYRRIYQSNNSSLYFASCRHPQETWLALLEKAFAKAHGDYAAIEGGYGGEGIEDLTGGVTSEIFTTDILDKEYFWKEELLKVNKDFLFGCSTGVWGLTQGERKGIFELHAYSIQKSVEIDGKRLLRLKNPWGKGEWRGAWSDGSKEWTPYWIKKLDHKFGDDGEFWIEYKDLLRKYQAFERTRLFSPEWRVAQAWTTLSVPWAVDYHDTHFSFSLSNPGPVVIVLAQLDDRYFRGLQGQYRFELAFRLHKAGHEDYLLRSQRPYRMTRSVNVELNLEEGEYQVRIKVTATRFEKLLPIDQVIRKNAKSRPEKLIRVGLAYDLAHGKGKFVETAEEKAAREYREKKVKDAEKAAIRKKILDGREQAYYAKKKQLLRDRRNFKKNQTRPRKGQNGSINERSRQQLSLDGADSNSGSEKPKPSVAFDARSDDDLDSLESLSDLSDRELDMQVEAYLSAQGKPVTSQEKKEQNEDLDEFESDPWNAAAVVGLRVYHKVAEKDENQDAVKVKVVRPHLLAGLDEDEADIERKGKGLDVDDSAKDATLEGTTRDRKISIVGDQRRSSE